MAVLRRVAWAALVVGSGAVGSGPVYAEGNCTTVDVDFMPAAQSNNPFAPQIVAWVEDTNGNYLETIFITEQTGTYGIGNRPGRADFNSGPAWPYGRRTMVFPIWAHRHGLSWDTVVFQNGDDNNLSHPFNQSSRENHFCRPLTTSEPGWDAMSCASAVYTDKGVLAPAMPKSLYPPRNDVARAVTDDPSVDMFAVLNPFDSVSQATPVPGTPATVSWAVPESLPFGNYVLFVEVAREFDMNGTYNPTVYPAPVGIPYDNYGAPYRGQPSVLFKVPFTIESTMTSAAATDYVGYGDPDGIDGNVRAADGTISVDVPGSGATRLALVSQDSTTYRVRVTSKPQFDFEPPAVPAELQAVDVTQNKATLAFVAPGDDGVTGRAKRYEIRYLVGEDMTAANFDTAVIAGTSVVPVNAGGYQTFELTGLLPETEYSIGIRAFDDCRNASELSVLKFTTPERTVGQVDACFIATAAYGSVMANDVDLLRRFRDVMLRKTVLGELAVESYYTFGPAVAGAVGESDLLRATARRVLSPIVDRVRGFSVPPPKQ
ncbi:MAG TPA: CFI-box-CTERM domain-containing protein [Kofleriaceae bacterium]|nr:CFI-box-CTERM domain-containing protein [Kofleriaceae bacterium]